MLDAFDGLTPKVIDKVGTIGSELITVDFDSLNNEPKPSETQPNNEIWYTTTNGEAITAIVEPIMDEGVYIGPALVSNIAPKDNNGKGVIKFAEDITHLGIVDSAFVQTYAVIAPEDMSCLLTSISLPQSLYYLGYFAIPYRMAETTITIPDSVTELWEYPDYRSGLGGACPFLSSRIYDEDTGEVIGGLEKIKTSKGEYTWQPDPEERGNDYMDVTLSNNKTYRVYDLIGL